MAQSREQGGLGRGIGPSISRYSEKGKMGVSTRSSELDSATKRMVKKQNKAAESYKIKDMDKLDKNRIAYINRKQAQIDRLKAEIRAAEKRGETKGAIKIGGIVAATVAAKKAKEKLDKSKKKK